MTNRYEKVSEDLAANIHPCARCGATTLEIIKRTSSRGIGITICCVACPQKWHGSHHLLYPADAIWFPTLYEAVSVWNAHAALVGEPGPTPDDGLPF